MNCSEARHLIIECMTGTTAPDTRRALAAHLETCAACRAVAADTAPMVSLLRAAPEPRVPEGQWAAFMRALDGRLARETSGWRRLVPWMRSPRLAWGTAAAASVLVVALGVARLLHPAGVEQAGSGDPSLPLQGMMTESVLQTMPAMSAALDLWKAGLVAADVPYELSGGGEE